MTGQPDRVEEISMRPGAQVGKKHGYASGWEDRGHQFLFFGFF